MSNENNITFENDSVRYRSRSILGVPQVPKMVTFLTNKGLVKNERQAKAVLLGMTACFFVASIVVFMVFVLEVDINGGRGQTTVEEMQAGRDRFEKAAKEYKDTNTQTNQ
jgi:hypothetical protein